jgi:replicative DNA helicase
MVKILPGIGKYSVEKSFYYANYNMENQIIDGYQLPSIDMEVNPSDTYENGSTLPEEFVLDTIIRFGVIKQIPVLVFSFGTAAQLMNKLIPLQTKIEKEKIKEGNLSPVEWKSFDRKMKELYDAPVWVNDIEIESIENYKSAEDVIINEKIKYVFIDSLSETIDESKIIKRGENIGFNVYFKKITYE